MKKTTKTLLAAIAMCTICIGITTTVLIFSLKHKNKVSSPDISAPGVDIKVENDMSKSLKNKNKYMIKLDGTSVMAYTKSGDGEYSLWNSVKVSPDLSFEEREKLERGIIVDSFEELCLYFEAYSS